jgi:hypothetical protein
MFGKWCAFLPLYCRRLILVNFRPDNAMERGESFSSSFNGKKKKKNLSLLYSWHAELTIQIHWELERTCLRELMHSPAPTLAEIICPHFKHFFILTEQSAQAITWVHGRNLTRAPTLLLGSQQTTHSVPSAKTASTGAEPGTTTKTVYVAVLCSNGQQFDTVFW